MTNPQIKIFDALTNNWISREMTDDEVKQTENLPDLSTLIKESTLWEGDTMPHMTQE